MSKKSWLDVQAQRVMVNGSYSIWVPAVGPGLFNNCMNDLEEVMGCTLVKFLDGTNLGG